MYSSSFCSFFGHLRGFLHIFVQMHIVLPQSGGHFMIVRYPSYVFEEYTHHSICVTSFYIKVGTHFGFRPSRRSPSEPLSIITISRETFLPGRAL